MIDIGVASPSAHGHAMISTATAFDERVGQPRLGPDRPPDEGAQDAPPPRRPARSRRTRGPPGAGSARGSAGPRRPCGRSGRAACPGRRARPASRSRPAPLTVPPVTRSPGRLLDGHRLAGDHRLVDGAAPLERRRRRPGTRSPGRTRSRSPTTTSVERHVLLPPVGPEDPRRRRGQAQQRPDGAARPAPGAQLQHLAQQHQHRDHRRHLEVDADLAPVARGRRAGRGPGRAWPPRCSRTRCRCRARSA